MCTGNFPVDVPPNTTQTAQITIQMGGITSCCVQTPTPITVEGSLNVSGADAIYIPSTAGAIESITNSGSITSDSGYGINNLGAISILNNAQGGDGSTPSTTALTYSGNLPTTYNVIILSPTHYGQLSLPTSTDLTPMGFGIAAGSVLTPQTYNGIFIGGGLTNTIYTGTYDGFRYTTTGETTFTKTILIPVQETILVNGQPQTITRYVPITTTYSGINLIVTGVSISQTQQSLINTANALQGVYSLQNSVLANSFTYDCNVFDVNNICISAGGRNTQVSAANGLNNTSALLIAAYRMKQNLRLGAYADQNLSVNNSGNGVTLGNNTPLVGVFGVWNEKLDGTGFELKASAAVGQKNTTITRQVVNSSEPGSGSTTLNSQGAQVMAKYGFDVAKDVILSPYLGVRYSQQNLGSYSEASSTAVTAPLSYSALNTNTTTALAGIGAAYKATPDTTLFASGGVESDTTVNYGAINATGVSGLTPVNFNPAPVKTRPTAMLGGYYDLEKNQRLGLTAIYRQEAFASVTSTTVMATYTVGL